MFLNQDQIYSHNMHAFARRGHRTMFEVLNPTIK